MLKWFSAAETQSVQDKTALVLSAGMMFGAYQAGVWAALAGVLRPDVVIGASCGALNAWAIAGGCEPARLAELWLEPVLAEAVRLRVPFPPWHGIFDSARLAKSVERFHSAFRPQVEVVVLATEVVRLRPRLFRGNEITSKHLVASCSMPFGYRPVLIDGRLHIDGGFLGALPLWAAAQMGATRAVAVHALPRLPSLPARAVMRIVRFAAPRLPRVPAEIEVLTITPSERMGSIRDLIIWRRENVERWLELGRRDAQLLLAQGLEFNI